MAAAIVRRSGWADMSKRDVSYKPLSLAQYFEAPDEFVGCFGWICGYSADSGFLNDAAERFTRRTDNQRAYEGRISIALMLDPSNPQILPIEVPGVLHLPIKERAPFRLLHAKVAILGFRHETDAKQWRLRLIVSTGNWTRDTLETSLDLVWSVELTSEDLKTQADSLAQISADMNSAWNMLKWLQGYFDVRVLHAAGLDRNQSPTETANQLLERWIAKTRRFQASATPQFFDNRKESFLTSLPRMIDADGASSSRNYLAMGSGFYETSSRKDQIPSVLKAIVERLQGEKLLSQKPVVDVFVNPHACQAVAGSLAAMTEANWTIREAAVADFFGQATRTLHAKFLFGASESRNSDLCNSAWVYLGSGNLTGPGFTKRMSRDGGNLEAGVIFRPQRLRWRPSKKSELDDLVTNFLPLQWDSDVSEKSEPLHAGDEFPNPEVNFTAAPVAYFFWREEDGKGWLWADQIPQHPYEVLDENGAHCPRDTEKGIQWLGAKPREVRVWWNENDEHREASLPVIDEYGRIAATTMPKLAIDQAWSQLENFPMPPDDEEIREGEEEKGLGDGKVQITNGSATTNYPVRQMMQLIENIASKQTTVPRVDWPMWCTRLEQCLTQASGSKVLEEFLKLKINPLSPLKNIAFRPSFAESKKTIEGDRYEEALVRVEKAWQVGSLNILGAPL